MATRYTALVNTPTTVTTDGPQGTGSLRTISTGNPQNLGVPASGSATNVSASDHVHQMPNAGDVGADPAGSAATAEINAQSYTDAAIKAASISSGRVVLVNLVGVPNLSAVTLNTLDPLYTPVQNDEVLITGACSPNGVTPASTAYAGVYTVGAVAGGVAALTRAANYNEAAEICGATWFVTGGTYADDFWACTNDVASTTIDVTPLVFVQIAGTLSNNAAQPLGVAGASGTDHDVSRSDHVHPFPTASDVGAVPTSRNITTTSPLSGGGSLSGDLTLSVSTATTSAVGVVLLSSATPQPLGAAAAGSTGNASDAGHVHAMPAFPPAMVPIGGYSTVDGTEGTVVIGGSPYALLGTDYSRTGLTATWELVVGGSVTSPNTGTVTLWDVGAGAAAATISITSSTAATSHSAVITAPGTAKTYELRASVTGGTAANYVVINSAAIRITWA